MMRYLGLMILWISLGACKPAEPFTLDQTATPNTLGDLADNLVLVASTDLPTLQVIQEMRATSEASPTEIPPTEAPCPTPLNDNPRPQYEAQAKLNWATRQIQVDQSAIYTNLTGKALDEVVFHVETSRIGGFFTLQGILDAQSRPLEDINAEWTRLAVSLLQPLGIGCQTQFTLSYLLKIPPVLPGYEGRLGYWGYTERQINLGHWLAVFAPFRADEWNVPRPYLIGEQITAESSDFKVELTLENAPSTVNVAGAGVVQKLDDAKWSFTLAGARDLTISLGDGFRRISQIADSGTLVEVHYYPEVAPSGLNPAPQALDAAVKALPLYEELFGIAYPYARLVIVQGDFPDGMEFSGLVFVGEAWFRTWGGLPNDWLSIITVHEVAHQWWYGLVGNDPANTPYLDEALATYSEYLYFQRYYGELNDWWWNFRVKVHDLSLSVVDAPIYRYTEGRPYINGAYLQGAEMLHALRLDLGDEVFFAWMKNFAQRNAYQLASPQDLWGALEPEVYPQTLPIRQRFLADWDILPASP